MLIHSTRCIGMAGCRTGASDSVPGGCFDRRPKQRNNSRLVKGATALPDAVVENTLLQRAIIAIAPESDMPWHESLSIARPCMYS
jgi:hypothetical protein